jgi:hypothetical protein
MFYYDLLSLLVSLLQFILIYSKEDIGICRQHELENDSILLRICQHTCRLVAAVFSSGHPVHVKYLLRACRVGVSS